MPPTPRAPRPRLHRRSLVASLLVAAATAGVPALAHAKEKPDAKAAPAAAPPPARPADPARDAVERIQKFYETTRDLRARFDQEQRSAVAGTRRASGEVWLKKPGRMRWDYDKPEKKLMVADGKTLWVYEPEDEQAFRHDLKSSSLPSSVSFLLGGGKLGDEFDVTLEAIDPARKLDPGDVLLKLVPKKATAQYRYLEFVVDGKSYAVKRTVIYDQQGGENHMTFSDLRANTGVADGKFTFTPPPGTRILQP